MKRNDYIFGIIIFLIVIMFHIPSPKEAEASGPSDRAIERIVNALESQAESLKAIRVLMEREDRRRR